NRFIDQAEYDAANREPDQARPHEAPVEIDAPYFAELIRREAIDRLGNNALTDGYVVRTTLDSVRQEAATRAVRDGLIAYDRRHGYRGAEAHVELAADAGSAQLEEALSEYRPLSGLVPGIVSAVERDAATVHLADGQDVSLEVKGLEWARPYISEDRRGATPKAASDVFKVGDIVRLSRDAEGAWTLAQVPAAEAALVAVDPNDGAVVSLVGGFSFQRSKFNRATQSARQPGSSFKPFLYSAAFDRGFTPASVLNDAPVQFPDPSRPDGVWAPKNDDDSFQGPIRLREALVKSVNLVSVRLLDAIGVRYAREYITRFGLTPDQIPENLSMALGTAAVAPLAMARGYAVLANGGHLVDPYFVREIADRDGNIVYRATPATVCADCAGEQVQAPPPATATGISALNPIGSANAATTPAAASPPAPLVLDPRNAYLVSSLMRDVIKRGTGRAAMVLERNDLAGKTGSTNDHRDAWFSGFNARLAVSSWVGFDDFSSLGRGEFGAKAALPIWIDYMRVALEGVEEQPFDMPPGIARVRIDPASGMLAGAGEGGILEVMKSEDATRLASMPPPMDEQSGEQREAYDVF
ncbi:MAG TPA: penicillin-binding transpeptidase domain-containing protein, partial [Dokdonella sp.]